MSKLLLKSGRVVDPAQGIDEVADLLIEDGIIAGRGTDLVADGAEVVDCAGLVVAPGFIDMHVHLREPGQEYKEDVASGTAAAAAGGFTGVACMPNTDPVNDNVSVTELIIERADEYGAVPVYPIGAVSVGQRGEALAEIGDLVEGGCVAVSDDGYPVATAELMRRALEYTRMFDIPVIEHCEDMSLTRKAAMNESAVSTALGFKGWPTAAEDIIVGRDLLLAELTGGRLHCAHISSAGALRLIRDAKARGIDVTCEVTPHHFSLTDEAVRGFDTNTKMNPPLRTQADVDAVLEALADGTVDAIVTDHAPHHADEKALEFDLAPFGIVGLETSVPLACDRLLHTGKVSLQRLIELMSLNPARILRLDAGDLSEGAVGNVTVLDLERTATVDRSKFASKSRNTPFDGWELKGWPAYTIVAGEIVWRAS
ncbi:MAG: dihydroorotase [Acidobacteriota bacterium]|jgi:dihydroorotase